MRHRRIHLALAGFLAVSAVWVGTGLFRDDDAGRTLTAVPAPVAAVERSSDDAPAARMGEGLDVGTVDSVDEDTTVVAAALRGEPGARAAAVGWVAVLGRLLASGPIATGELLGELLTEEAAAETADGFRRERQRFIEQFGVDPSQALWVESPLTVHVAELSGDRATVLVWSQLIAGSPEATTVDAVYRTHTVSLLWERDRWRVDDVSRREGPTPMVAAGELPSPGEHFAVVAAWTPAVLAGVPVED